MSYDRIGGSVRATVIVWLAAVGICVIFSPAIGDEGRTSSEASRRDAGRQAEGRTVAAGPMVEVDFRDTLQGVQAMYAVRACIAEDALTRAPGGAHFAIKEALVATGDDATVRVLDRDGQVISQHVGSHEVCGYARLAGAFLASINRFSTAEDK